MPAPPAVDVHAHHLPAALAAALRARVEPPCILAGGPTGELVDGGGGLVYPLLPDLRDPEGLSERSGREGIAVSIFNVPPPGVDGLPAAEAAAVARACNEEMAALAAAADGAIGALALLPTEHPEAAVEELRHAQALGLAGAQLFSNAGGASLDGAKYRPLFAAADELGFPLVIHPALPTDRGAVGDPNLLSTLGFVFDETACAARLVLGGLFERHPDLVLVLPHVGATLPFLLGRFDYELEMIGAAPLSTPPSEQLRLLHLDSIAASPAALRLGIDEFGAERILFGSDEPYWSAARGLATLEAACADERELALIRRGNAERVFGLGVRS